MHFKFPQSQCFHCGSVNTSTLRQAIDLYAMEPEMHFPYFCRSFLANFDNFCSKFNVKTCH
jgi:hypothetical protein